MEVGSSGRVRVAGAGLPGPGQRCLPKDLKPQRLSRVGSPGGGRAAGKGRGRRTCPSTTGGHGKGRGVGHGRDFRVSPGQGDKSGSRSGCAWLLATEPVGFGTQNTLRGWGKGHCPPLNCAIQNGLKPQIPDQHPPTS